MKILQRTGGLLSNHEVAQVLKDRGADPQAGLNTRATASEKTVYSVLIKQCGGLVRARAELLKLMDELKPFGLTRAEVLQVINLAPCSAVEVHLIVDECEERLSEEQVTQLLEVVSRHLPHAQQALGS